MQKVWAFLKPRWIVKASGQHLVHNVFLSDIRHLGQHLLYTPILVLAALKQAVPLIWSRPGVRHIIRTPLILRRTAIAQS